jgi:hypothetical protein
MKIIGALFATVLLATSAVASDFQGPVFDPCHLFGWGTTNTDNWTLSLAGVGATTTQGSSQSVFGFDFQLGHADTVFIPGEIGVRQLIGWSSRPDKNGGDWLLNTAVYQDWKLLSYKSLELYAGGNAGASYGNTSMAWTAGPEVEARLWLKKDVYTFFRTEYDFALSDKNQDSLRYFLGVGFSFK